MDEAEKQKNYELAEQLYSEQNFVAAVNAGVVAIVPAALAYGIVSGTIPQAIGFGAALAGVTPLYILYLFVAVFAAVYLAKRGLSRSDRLAIGMHELRK